MTATPECQCATNAEAIARIEQKIDFMLSSVQGALGALDGLKSNPMMKMLGL